MNLENVLHNSYPKDVFLTSRKFFWQRKRFFSISKLYFFRFSSTSRDIKFPFETVWNHKKSLTAYVYANKSRTKCRTSLLFVSMGSCDPKEVCKYQKYTMETNKKFSDESKANTWPNSGTFWGCWDFVNVWESQNGRRSTLNRVEISHSSRLRQ